MQRTLKDCMAGWLNFDRSGFCARLLNFAMAAVDKALDAVPEVVGAELYI